MIQDYKSLLELITTPISEKDLQSSEEKLKFSISINIPILAIEEVLKFYEYHQFIKVTHGTSPYDSSEAVHDQEALKVPDSTACKQQTVNKVSQSYYTTIPKLTPHYEHSKSPILPGETSAVPPLDLKLRQLEKEKSKQIIAKVFQVEKEYKDILDQILDQLQQLKPYNVIQQSELDSILNDPNFVTRPDEIHSEVKAVFITIKSSLRTLSDSDNKLLEIITSDTHTEERAAVSNDFIKYYHSTTRTKQGIM